MGRPLGPPRLFKGETAIRNDICIVFGDMGGILADKGDSQDAIAALRQAVRLEHPQRKLPASSSQAGRCSFSNCRHLRARNRDDRQGDDRQVR